MKELLFLRIKTEGYKNGQKSVIMYFANRLRRPFPLTNSCFIPRKALLRRFVWRFVILLVEDSSHFSYSTHVALQPSHCSVTGVRKAVSWFTAPFLWQSSRYWQIPVHSTCVCRDHLSESEGDIVSSSMPMYQMMELKSRSPPPVATVDSRLYPLFRTIMFMTETERETWWNRDRCEMPCIGFQKMAFYNAKHGLSRFNSWSFGKALVYVGNWGCHYNAVESSFLRNECSGVRLF